MPAQDKLEDKLAMVEACTALDDRQLSMKMKKSNVKKKANLTCKLFPHAWQPKSRKYLTNIVAYQQEFQKW